MSDPLRNWLKKDIEWHWNEIYTQSLNKIKDKLMSAPVLAAFDGNKKIVIQTDSSQSGVGCCIMQDNKPISYA